MRNKTLFFIISAVIFLESSVSWAQQDAQFSHYMFNNMYSNPAFAGIDGVARVTAIARQQYLGYNAYQNPGGAPRSFVLTGSTLTPLLNKSVGAGINFLYDHLGPLTTTQVQVSASYLLKLKTGNLGFGFRTGILYQQVNPDGGYRVNDQTDNIYQDLSKPGRTSSQFKPDLTLGLAYRTTKYYVGLSFSHIVSHTFTYGFDSVASRLKDHMYLNGGYNFNLGSLIVLTPTAIIQTDLKQLTYVFGALATYNDRFWFGLNLRESFSKKDVNTGGKTLNNDDIIFLVGVTLLKNRQNVNALRIGYAFDLVTSGIRGKANTSQEIMLSYIIIPPWDILKPKVRTPRYRHDEN